MPLLNYFRSLYANWKPLFSERKLRNQLLITLSLYIFLFKYCRVIMAELEMRKGARVIDPLLSYLPAYDLSPVIFTLTYLALGSFIFFGLLRPKAFIIGLQAYCLLIVMRTIAIYAVPLEPPVGMILLKDPVTYFFMSTPTGDYIVKDLFFSGHVSTIVLFSLASQQLKLKKWLVWLAGLVGVFILIQHVHYTIDVVAAPFFAALAYKISLELDRLLHGYYPEPESEFTFEENKRKN